MVGEKGKGVDRVADFAREGCKTCSRGVDGGWGRNGPWSACVFGFRVVHFVNLVVS